MSENERMTITEFLLARVAEEEELAKLAAFGWGGSWKSVADHEDEWYTIRAEGKREVVGGEDSDVINHIARHDPARVLTECAAKRKIIAQHEQWPVLVERQPSELETVRAGLESITYRMTSEIAWLTTREYVKRFDTQPPTAPMLLTLAAVYKDHLDYRQEWEEGLQ